MLQQELKKLRKSHISSLIAKQDDNELWHVGSYANKDYDLALLHATRLAEKQYSDDEYIIIMKYANGLYRKYNPDGTLITEDYVNNETENVVTGCPVNLTACQFPLCTNDMACEKNKNKKPVKKEDTTLNSVKQYFDYQTELNTVRRKVDDLVDAQEELQKEIETDIRTVFTAFDISDLDYKIELTLKGIKIILNTKKYNNHKIVTPINTDLFTKLNQLIGINGVLNIAEDRKIAGNHVKVIELIYETE